MPAAAKNKMFGMKFFSLCSLVMVEIVFFFFERILCEESIVIKKINFDILIYLYVLRPPEFTYAVFEVTYVSVCACVCVCVHRPTRSFEKLT